MEQIKTTDGERVVLLFNIASKAVLVIAVIVFIIGFALYSGFNNLSGVSLMMLAPFFLIAYPFLRGMEIVIRAALRYLQIHGEPYAK
jgi:hypothetical protein